MKSVIASFSLSSNTAALHWSGREWGHDLDTVHLAYFITQRRTHPMVKGTVDILRVVEVQRQVLALVCDTSIDFVLHYAL